MPQYLRHAEEGFEGFRMGKQDACDLVGRLFSACDNRSDHREPLFVMMEDLLDTRAEIPDGFTMPRESERSP